jgi:hypothetical protein
MIQSAETRLHGTTLVVRIPMRFHRRGGRKRIVAPDGSELVPATKPQPNGALLKALARAHKWRRMLEQGRFASVRELLRQILGQHRETSTIRSPVPFYRSANPDQPKSDGVDGPAIGIAVPPAALGPQR